MTTDPTDPRAATALAAREPLFTRPFMLAFGAHFLHCISFYLYLHLPGFLRVLGADEIVIGVLSGITAATAIALRPLMGRVMDRRGRRALILGGGALHVAACIAYLGVRSLGPWLLVARIMHGVAEATLFAALFAFAADLVPASRRVEGIALFGVSGMLPMSLSALLGDAILAHHGYATLFLCATGASSTALLLSVPLRDQPKQADEEPPRHFLAAVMQPDLVPIWIVGTLFAGALAAYFTFLKTFVLRVGFGSVSAFFITYSLAAIALRIGFGWLPDRVGPKRVLYPSLGLLGAGLVLLATARDANALIVAGFLCGIGHGYVFPVLLALVVARARPAERGSALAIYTALFDAGTLLGAPALGAVIRVASYSAMFVTAAVAVAVGTALFAWLDAGPRGVPGTNREAPVD